MAQQWMDANGGKPLDCVSAFGTNLWEIADKNGNGDDSGCKTPAINDETSDGWIYCASDYIVGDLSRVEVGWHYQSRIIGSNSFLNPNWSKMEPKSLLMILSHEIKHRYDSMFRNGYYNKEGSANDFMWDVWQYYNPEKEYRK